ncbi:MAG TPA: hypothetical protein VFW13_06795 [Phenylobacterium sp.]|nr:hypothetical protein [Phenylobacterium sp.]
MSPRDDWWRFSPDTPYRRAPVYLVYPPDRTPTAKLKAFTDFALAQFAA